MAANEIHVGDVGTVLTLVVTDNGTAVDISTASSKLIYLLPPDTATALQKTGVFTSTGSDGSMYYTTIAGDLSKPGVWQVQAHVVLGTTTFSSDIGTFEVFRNLV